MNFWQWIRRPINLIELAVVVLAVGFVSYLLTGNRGEVLHWEASNPGQEESAREWEEWYGIYFQGRKIGYSQASREVVPEGYVYRDRTHLWLNVAKEEVEAETQMEARVSSDLKLKSFEFRLRSEQAELLVEGKLEGKKLVLGVGEGSQRTEQVIELEEAPLVGPMVRDYFFADPEVELETGKTYKLPFFDPSSLANAELEVEIMGVEELKVGEEVESVYRLKEVFKGMESVSWVTREGKTIKEYSPTGFVVVREPQDQAEKEDTKSEPLPDIISAFSVPVEGEIKKPRELKYLKARLKGVALTGFDLTGHRQILDGREVEVRREDIDRVKSYVIPWSPAQGGGREIEHYLEATPFIPLGDGALSEKAIEAVGGHDDSFKAARAINAWVNQYLEKSPTFSIPNALQILEGRQGDCNEHALLFTALARAVGLPARTVAGVVYLEGKFYYHAWAEAYVGGGTDGWISLDPVFGQLPADATHIRFVTGGLDQHIEIARFVGFLEMEILEAR